MPDLHDLTTARELLGLHEDIEALELRLKNMKARREELMQVVDEQLDQLGKRSLAVDGVRITIARTPRWQCAVADGIKWAIKRGHTDILTVKGREFSDKIQSFVDQGFHAPDWLKKFPILTLRVKR